MYSFNIISVILVILVIISIISNTILYVKNYVGCKESDFINNKLFLLKSCS